MLDCLWGPLDGVNDTGLAVSLAFGGRPQVAAGFGIPLVIRYVLETCGSTEEATRTLRRRGQAGGNRDHADIIRVFPAQKRG
jgi:predicted choloylglycine hydrolase